MKIADSKDIIAAIATPPGKSALGIIRVSGIDCIKLVNLIFRGSDLEKAVSHTIHYGFIKDGEQIIDEVLVSIYCAPKTYTGDDMVEISCHGSMFILKEVLALLQRKGARLAEPGEFTLRAFLNGKLDLSQAEAVIDMIDSENKAQHRIAVNQIRGGFSGKIRELREKLLNLVSLFELELDFAEEDVEFATHDQLQAILDEIKSEVLGLLQSFRLGNVIKKGVGVVIAGQPNAGKSTLLNTLLQEERAITSNIPGTTRDFIEDSLVIDGVLFRFIDTAGLNANAKDHIEEKGIQRTLEKLGQADLVLYLFDANCLALNEVKMDIEKLQLSVPCLVIANKIDKVEDPEKLKKNFDQAFDHMVYISSKFQYNIEELKLQLLKTLNLEKYQGDWSFVSNARHYQVLKQIEESVNEVEEALQKGLSKDLIAIDIHEIVNSLGEITGEITNDEILGNIFGRFCIGK